MSSATQGLPEPAHWQRHEDATGVEVGPRTPWYSAEQMRDALAAHRTASTAAQGEAVAWQWSVGGTPPWNFCNEETAKLQAAWPGVAVRVLGVLASPASASPEPASTENRPVAQADAGAQPAKLASVTGERLAPNMPLDSNLRMLANQPANAINTLGVEWAGWVAASALDKLAEVGAAK